MRSTARLLVAVMLLHSGFTAYADDADQPSTISPISQIQAADPLLPSGVTDQKGLIGTVLSKVFRSTTDRKIATAFVWAFDSLFNGTGCS